ncbi:MAG: glycosyltransferase family 1 protein [Bacteroidota bacterium]
MHLCVDARMYLASGIGTYLQNLLPALAESFELTIIGSSNELKSIRGKIISTDVTIYSLTELIKFPSLVPSCDIFWSPHYNVPILPIRAKRRLVTIHDVFHLAHTRSLSQKQRVYAKLMMHAATRLSDHIITVSKFSKAEITKYTQVNPQKITVIPNGVDLQHLHPNYTLSHAKKTRNKYQLPEEYILYVGNVKPHKNLTALVKAYEAIAQDIPHKLVIVGKKEGFITNDSLLRSKIQHSQFLAERVLFTGFVAHQDLPIIYNLADLFVFPSLYEGFGLPPLEAMACGCLTLTSNRASMPKICGEATTYFNPEDQLDLSSKILKLISLDDPDRQKAIRLGIAKATSYTWEASIEEHTKVIRLLS